MTDQHQTAEDILARIRATVEILGELEHAVPKDAPAGAYERINAALFSAALRQIEAALGEVEKKPSYVARLSAHGHDDIGDGLSGGDYLAHYKVVVGSEIPHDVLKAWCSADTVCLESVQEVEP